MSDYTRKYIVASPVLNGGKKFYPVEVFVELTDEQRERMWSLAAALVERRFVLEYFETLEEAETFAQAKREESQ